jgi:hypothetical protein
MKEIQLTQDKVALVDDEDFEYLNQFKWYAKKCKYTFYAVRAITHNKKQITTPMHRVILNTPTNMEVDHNDHNGLNNQRLNINNCTHRENRCNKRVFTKGSSIYRGVRISRNQFRATIKFHNKSINLGSFKSEIEAALVYDKKAIELQGIYAILNFR